jgi:phi LC3 family holin
MIFCEEDITMKVNIPVRFKNPWFWVGVASVALTAIGVEPSVFTSWGAVWEQICAVLSNPFQLATMALAVLAVFIDPTTAGVTDSDRAMEYEKPLER